MVGRGITLCGPILTPLIEKRRRRSFLRGIPTHSAIEIVVGALRQDKGPAPAFRSVLSRLGELRQLIWLVFSAKKWGMLISYARLKLSAQWASYHRILLRAQSCAVS